MIPFFSDDDIGYDFVFFNDELFRFRLKFEFNFN